jgi:iron complex outermembrane receptor protein
LANGTFGYSFTDFYGGENVASKYISNYARHMINAIATLDKGAFNGTVSMVWKKRQSTQNETIEAFRSSNYSMWNVKLGYKVTQNITVGLQVDNIFDQKNQDILGAQMPGRWALGTLSWRL